MRWSRAALAGSGLVLAAALLWGGARPVGASLTRPAVAPGAGLVAEGAAAFEGGAFGGISMDALSRNALPWRLVAAALLLDEQARDPAAAVDGKTLDHVLGRFGFLTEARVVNRPAGVVPPMTGLPLGMTIGNVAPVGGSVVRVANLGCAACHAGVAYRADGTPDPGQAVLGMPNSSLDLATRQNAEVLGLADEVGALRPGLRADIVLVDFRTPHLQPVHDLAHSLALSAHQGDVTTVIVDGRVVVRDRRLLTLDLDAAVDELAERLPALTDRSHGRRVQDYAP